MSMDRTTYAALIALVLVMPSAFAGDSRFDYALVIDAVPITVSESVPVRRQVSAKSSNMPGPGDARRDRPDASIGDLIRVDSRQRRPECRNVTRYETRTKTVGWRVTYRYAGRVYVQRMKQRPGERVRVRVDRTMG